MLYRFTCDYSSGIGSWSKGDDAEFDVDTAAWLLRDVEGCIVPLSDAPDATEPDERALEAPLHDRQLKRAPRSR